LVTSATTATQLGRVFVAPNKIVNVVVGVSGSAVTPVSSTLNYFLGSKNVASQNVSASTTGNIVVPAMGNSLGQPLYDSIAVSVSLPATISQTNGLYFSFTENDK
jgi:hypothetical protein